MIALAALVGERLLQRGLGDRPRFVDQQVRTAGRGPRHEGVGVDRDRVGVLVRDEPPVEQLERLDVLVGLAQLTVEVGEVHSPPVALALGLCDLLGGRLLDRSDVNLGGAQKLFNVTPHLSVFGKAMANGYDISMLVGRRDIMDMLTQKVFVSSTYFPNSTSMAASLKTIEMLERDNILDVIKKRGEVN